MARGQALKLGTTGRGDRWHSSPFRSWAASKLGWTAALALAVCCALRLARFNSRMDAEDQPHKAAGLYTGIPAPVGAGLAFVPIYLWFVTGNPLFQAWYVTMPWVLFIAVLMISTVATYSWGSIRLRRS